MRALRRSFVALSAFPLLAAFTAGGFGVATASIQHPAVVSENPVDWTPHLAPGGGVTRPLALAVSQLGDTMYVGGRFQAVQDAARTTTVPRQNLVAFSATGGTLNTTFTPDFDDDVFAVLAVGSSVYVGGQFDEVDGVPRPAIAKLDAQTGTLDPAFAPTLVTSNSRVSEIRLVNGRLIVGGTFGKNLAALNPATGADTGYINVPINGQVSGSTGKTEVYRFAVNPAGTRLVGVGNFTDVGGQIRQRAFMLDLNPGSAALSPWYYEPLNDACRSASPTRRAYLRDVDFSPDGSYFVFVSTGYITAQESQIGTHICDAAARFETAEPDPDEPTWINYTGGDTLHSVAVTGAAVYVQGHNRWLDNPQGADSAGPGAVSRRGIGAIHPTTGFALPWDPPKPASQGGQDFLATPTGLWVPSDSQNFNGEYHRGIAFVPLP